MALTLADAQRIMDGALAKANEMGVKVSIAVVNGEGNVITLSRMDGTGFLSPDIALGKASAAAALKKSTAEIQKSAEARTALFAGISTIAHGRFVAGVGGLPMMKGAEVLGGVGVSGAKPEEDQEIAQAAIDCL